MRSSRFVRWSVTRRICVVAIFVAAFHLMAPSPALAIWGQLVRLSGPGPFNGPELQLRLVCLGDKDDTRIVPGIETGCIVGQDKKRRVSIDVGLRFFKAKADPQVAGNNDIMFTTVVPSISWSVFAARPKADFLGVGAGVGVYWFSSVGFAAFSGVLVEPIQFDLHMPSLSDPKDPELWDALLQIATLRVGWIIFPAGFEASAFNATGSAARRIPGEAVFTKSLFLNFEPLLRRLTK